MRMLVAHVIIVGSSRGDPRSDDVSTPSLSRSPRFDITLRLDLSVVYGDLTTISPSILSEQTLNFKNNTPLARYLHKKPLFCLKE